MAVRHYIRTDQSIPVGRSEPSAASPSKRLFARPSWSRKGHPKKLGLREHATTVSLMAKIRALVVLVVVMH